MKGKLGRFIFRKIGGRVIPIKISNLADEVATASSKTNKYRKIIAKAGEEQVAKLNLEIPKKGKFATILDVNVEKKFQKKGISKNLFARAETFLSRIGKKFLRSNEIQHVAQIKIRRGLGRYKAGGKMKSRTKLFVDQLGTFGEQTGKITRQEAIDLLKRGNPKGQQITATTLLRKRPKK